MLARSTIAIAFQRTIERSRRSTSRSPGERRLVLRRDRVHVRRGEPGLDRRSEFARAIDDRPDEFLGAFGALLAHDGVEGLQPLTGFLRVEVLGRQRGVSRSS